MPLGYLFQNETGCSECDFKRAVYACVSLITNLRFYGIKRYFWSSGGMAVLCAYMWHLTCVVLKVKSFVFCTLSYFPSEDLIHVCRESFESFCVLRSVGFL